VTEKRRTAAVNNARNNPSTAGSVFDDYATRPVPEENRIGWLTQGSVWAGTVFCATMFSIGGMLAASMTPAAFLTAVLLGTALVTLIASLIGAIGARTHLPSAFNARFALGTRGGKLFGMILAVSMAGWFGCQCAYFADSAISMLRMFGYPGGSHAIWAIVGGLLMVVTVVAGLKGITLLSTLGAPLLFALALAAAGMTASRTGVSIPDSSMTPGGGMGLAGGIGVVVGSFIIGACIIPDLSRFSKNTRGAVGACLLGLMVAFPAGLLLGGFFYYAYGTSDLSEVLVSYCGLGVFAPFVLAVSFWTTNDYNLYCAVLGVSNALDDHVRLPRWRIALVVGAVSTLLGALGILEAFTSFLNLLTTLIPPIAAVIIADYYLYNRNSGLYDYEKADKLQNFRANTCLAALVGIAVGLLCNYTGINFLQELCAVIPACILEMLSSVAALVLYNTAARSRAAPSSR